MITGKCECGTVKYEVSGEATEYCHCHCSICRRLHGAAFVSWCEVARKEFTFVSGKDSLRRYAFSERLDSLFCEDCGSRMFVDSKPETDKLYIAMGTLDGDITLPPGFHQFVGSKAPWFEISDDLPLHDEWPNPA